MQNAGGSSNSNSNETEASTSMFNAKGVSAAAKDADTFSECVRSPSKIQKSHEEIKVSELDDGVSETSDIDLAQITEKKAGNLEKQPDSPSADGEEKKQQDLV